jgi:hypothetical protein
MFMSCARLTITISKHIGRARVSSTVCVLQTAWKAAPEIARLMAGALPPVCGGDLRLLQQLYPHIMCGYDRGGRPVRIECMGRVRVKEIYENTTPQEILDYHVWQCGQLVSRFLPAAERRTGHPTYQVTSHGR